MKDDMVLSARAALSYIWNTSKCSMSFFKGICSFFRGMCCKYTVPNLTLAEICFNEPHLKNTYFMRYACNKNIFLRDIRVQSDTEESSRNLYDLFFLTVKEGNGEQVKLLCKLRDRGKYNNSASSSYGVKHNKKAQTAFHIALSKNKENIDIEFIKLLLDYVGMYPDDKDGNGDTVLDLAEKNANQDVIDLLKSSADQYRLS